MGPPIRRSLLTFALATALGCLSVACAPTKPRVVSTPVAQSSEEILSYKRVDSWSFVDLGLPSTPVELQLRRQFSRVFPNAQYSEEYTCVAREEANFLVQHRAMPDETLDQNIMGRCRAGADLEFSSRTYYSDGTLLDSALTDATLTEISTDLPEGVPPFSVFGITARYDGPSVKS